MIYWDTAQTMVQDWSGDRSAAMLTKLNNLMNIGYKQILHKFNGEESEDIRTTYTQTGIRAIKLPPNYIRMHSVTATVGGKVYDLVEEENQDFWAQRLYNNQTSTRPTVYFLRQRFGVGGAELLLDPIPSDTDTLITINYAAKARDLSVAKYTTGTITATNGSSTITGSGTTFTEAMVGRYLTVNDEAGDGMWYRITGYVGSTSLTIENKYDGVTVSGKNYIVAEAFHLPEDLQMAPLYYAMWHYYLGIRDDKDEKQISKWQELYVTDSVAAEKNYKRKSKSNTIAEKARLGSFPVATPGYFPDEVT